MIDYSQWKESSLVVTSLLLDPRNPRIPESGENVSQRDLITEMVENEDVYTLAQSIVRNGYFPVENLIIVEEEGKKYVLEGNRRLAALKLLVSPESAPEEWQRRFRALANQITINDVRKVRVVKAPSREDAAPIVMNRHTEPEVKKWSPIMQAKFFWNLVTEGQKIQDIANRYNIRASTVSKGVQRYGMYSVALSLDLPEEIMKKLHDQRLFPATTLDRLIENPEVLRFLGIDFDENKMLFGEVDEVEFKQGYGKIVADIATGTVSSRKLNTVKEMNGYLTSISSYKPKKSKDKTTFTAKSLLKNAPAVAKKTKKAPEKKTAKKERQTKALIPRSLTCSVGNARINDVFGELQTLPVERYPNAVAFMFRSLLEMGLGEYLDKSGDLKTMEQNEQAALKKKGRKLPKNWHPTLSEMLKYVVAQGNRIISNGNLRKSVNKFTSQKDDGLVSLDSLQQFAHNQFFTPNEERLRAFWKQLEGLFQIILG